MRLARATPRDAGDLKNNPPRPTLCVRLPVLSMPPEQSVASAPVEPGQRVSNRLSRLAR
eukprot:gene23540-25023_t